MCKDFSDVAKSIIEEDDILPPYSFAAIIYIYTEVMELRETPRIPGCEQVQGKKYTSKPAYLGLLLSVEIRENEK